MGSRGPVPKRSEERRRRNKVDIDRVKAISTERPPLSGKGSSKKAWRDYATELRITVPKDAKRDEIVAIVEEAGRTAADDGWHPIAKEWFDSLGRSGQSRYFEPSDWAAARLLAEVMTRNLSAGKFSAVLFGSVWSAMTDLLTTEASRRRVRMEVERLEEPEAENVSVMDDYRASLGG